MLFLLVFIVPAIVLQPVRPMLVGLLPQPTAWQSVSMFLSTIIITILAIYAYNLRQRIKHLEREVKRAKYRATSGGGS